MAKPTSKVNSKPGVGVNNQKATKSGPTLDGQTHHVYRPGPNNHDHKR